MDRINLGTIKAMQSLSKIPNYNTELFQTINTLSKAQSYVNESVNKTITPMLVTYIKALNKVVVQDQDIYVHLASEISILANAMKNVSIPDFGVNSEDASDEELERNKVNDKVISEIFQPDSEKAIDSEESPIITLSPVNDQVLKYLSEHPESFYQLTDNDFEIVMAEIYSKLGYDVTRTKATRDGGKDLIIRIPEKLGDFIYYVECKKYAAKRPIGIGIIKNLVGTVNTDRVNGGILATTSFFTRDVYKFISDNKWNCQIKTHDYNAIKDLLSQAVIST